MSSAETYTRNLEDRAERELRTLESVARDSRTGSSDARVSLLSAAGIEPVAVRWLWPGWLAQGKLHIIAGAPGTGKTTIALSLAAAVSAGLAWPDGAEAHAGTVLIWSGEDDAADTILPRLLAAGAEPERVYIIGDTHSDGEQRPFDPARDLAQLEDAAADIGNISLMIADPVVSAVAGDSHKNGEVRRALQPIVDLAHRLDCAVLGVSHFSKGTAGRDPLERVTGSIAFGAVARVVLVTAKGKDGAPRLLARAKSNIGPDGDGFAYTLEQTEINGLNASRVAWGVTLKGSARELLGDHEIAASSPRDDAVEWLGDLLTPGPLASNVIFENAESAGLKRRTIMRAKQELGIISERVSADNAGAGFWQWRLPNTGKDANPTTKSGTLARGGTTQGFQGSQEAQGCQMQSGTLADSCMSPDDSAEAYKRGKDGE